MAPGQFLFINSETLGQYSVGIDTAFSTKSDTPSHNLGVLVQATLQPVVLPFCWVLGSCYYMDLWMECASPRPEDDPLWGSTKCQDSWLYISIRIDLEVWWFGFYEMVLRCTSPVVQKSTLIFNTCFSSVYWMNTLIKIAKWQYVAFGKLLPSPQFTFNIKFVFILEEEEKINNYICIFN